MTIVIYEQILIRVLPSRVGLLVGICVVSLLSSSMGIGQVAFAQKQLPKDIVLQCIEMYPKFKELGEKEFKVKYSHKRFLEDCVKLYKDPSWTFRGKNAIDKNFEKINSVEAVENVKEVVNTKIISKSKIGTDKYLIKFSACSDNQSSSKPRFVIESHLEKFVGIGTKDIAAKQCKAYWAQVKTKSPDSLIIKFTNNESVISALEKRPLI